MERLMLTLGGHVKRRETANDEKAIEWSMMCGKVKPQSLLTCIGVVWCTLFRCSLSDQTLSPRICVLLFLTPGMPFCIFSGEIFGSTIALSCIRVRDYGKIRKSNDVPCCQWKSFAPYIIEMLREEWTTCLIILCFKRFSFSKGAQEKQTVAWFC